MADVIGLVNLLATTLGGDYKLLAADVKKALDNQGDLTTLTTTAKDTLVKALNEINQEVTLVKNSAIDAATVQQMINTGINGLIDGAPDALNTLNEIAQALNEDQNALDGILQSLAKRVRVDAPQNFNAVEQKQGRDNIKAAASEDLGDVKTADFVATYNAAKA